MGADPVYHLVTGEKLIRGQVMHFGEQLPNRLRGFFFDKEIVNSDGEDLYRILRNNHSQGRIEEGRVLRRFITKWGDAFPRLLVDLNLG